jgi:hypothetical protein
VICPECHASRPILFCQVLIGGLLWRYRPTINGVEYDANARILWVWASHYSHHATRTGSPGKHQTAGPLATFADYHFDLGVQDWSIAASWPIEPTRQRAKLIGHCHAEDVERAVSVLGRVLSESEGDVGLGQIVVKVRILMRGNFHSCFLLGVSGERPAD